MITTCAGCGKDFEEDDGEWTEDEFHCYDCLEVSKIEFESNERDKKLDDPRRGQAKGLNR